MSRVVLVRHGETIWHLENRYAGRTDIPLTDKGIAQAERLALWAAGAGLRAVWSSPLLRAWHTATPAAVAAGTVVQIDSRLIELDSAKAKAKPKRRCKRHFRVNELHSSVRPQRTGCRGRRSCARCRPRHKRIAGVGHR